MTSLTGYLHDDYAASLAEFGEPIRLPRSGGWLLRRPIAETGLFDAMGPYPYLACTDWAALADDLQDLQAAEPALVSVTAAPDPFGDYAEGDLRRAFPDLTHPYKQHYVADLELPDEQIISDHHRREAARAGRKLSMEVFEQPLEHLDTWVGLFEHSVAQFAITGIQRFSSRAFERQLAIPGTRMWLVRRDGEAVAASVTMMHGSAAYTHLLAATPLGRKLGASYLIYQANIRLLRPDVRWIDWGAVPGSSDAENGLKQFKAGWATGTRAAFICGRITNRSHYEKLAHATDTGGKPYFPCYRSPY